MAATLDQAELGQLDCDSARSPADMLTRVSFDTSVQYNRLQADARNVAIHETGHVEALGHTGHVAVMHTGAENFYTPQADDINAMQSIYTGFIPA